MHNIRFLRIYAWMNAKKKKNNEKERRTSSRCWRIQFDAFQCTMVAMMIRPWRDGVCRIITKLFSLTCKVFIIVCASLIHRPLVLLFDVEIHRNVSQYIAKTCWGMFYKIYLKQKMPCTCWFCMHFVTFNFLTCLCGIAVVER